MDESQRNHLNANRRGQSAGSPELKPPARREFATNITPATGDVVNGTVRRLWDFLQRFFWLDDKMAPIATAGLEMSQSGWPEFEIVRQTRDGGVLVDVLGEKNAAVLILKRMEALLLIRGLIKRQGLACPEGYFTEKDWTLAEQVAVIRKLLASLTVNERAALKACLGQNGELLLVDLDAQQNDYLARALRRAVQQLIVPFDLDDHRINRLKFYRWTRIGTAAALVLCLLGVGVAALEKLTRKPNIALHRPVTVSSRAQGVGKVDGTRLVDGKRTNLGFHTELEANPFVVIDLGKSKRFDKIVVYNRNDCCQERSVPLFIEVSEDGKKYRVIAERHENFDTWTARLLNSAQGRFVRLRLGKTETFHLSEAEIY